MQHTLTTQAFGIRMRPVQLDDAPFIVRLRNLDYVKGKVGDSAADVPSQERWLQSYFKREGDYYFIIETLSEIPLGTLAIYNLNETRAEIGRIVIRPGVVAGVPACFLLLDLFYEKMGMTQVRATSVASNERAHSLLRRLGFSQVKVGAGSQVIGGQTVNTLHFVQNAEDWLHAREKLIPQAQRAGSGIREWEQAYLQNQCSQGPAIET